MKTLEQFKEEFYQKYPNSDIEIIEYMNSKNVFIKNKYGICKSVANQLIRGEFPCIRSAINKTEYFINQAKEVHGDEFDYSLAKYKNSKDKLKIICKIHGVFEVNYSNFVHSKSKCLKCKNVKQSLKRTFSLIQFIDKANKVHNYKYDYSKSVYINSDTKIIVTCPIHGDFEPNANNHIRGSGCMLCRNINLSILNRKNPKGWSRTNWWNSTKNSKKFDSFKVYIIECWNDEERFYKIGRTYQKINFRFCKSAMPYNHKVLQVFEFQEFTQENCNKCYDLENELKRKNKEFKYVPQIKFDGMHECFKNVNYE